VQEARRRCRRCCAAASQADKLEKKDNYAGRQEKNKDESATL